jgi:hypothetical protein
MSKLDLSKPYRTRDGREAWATVDPNGILVGWIRTQVGIGDDREAQLWFSDGRAEYSRLQSSEDLVNIPETITVKVWINMYPVQAGMLYASREAADRYSTPARTACIEREITFTVGEGLDK